MPPQRKQEAKLVCIHPSCSSTPATIVAFARARDARVHIEGRHYKSADPSAVSRHCRNVHDYASGKEVMWKESLPDSYKSKWGEFLADIEFLQNPIGIYGYSLEASNTNIACDIFNPSVHLEQQTSLTWTPAIDENEWLHADNAYRTEISCVVDNFWKNYGSLCESISVDAGGKVVDLCSYTSIHEARMAPNEDRAYVVSLVHFKTKVQSIRSVLIRFRAHYDARSLQLSTEQDVQPITGPVISSFFGLNQCMQKMEGVWGLFRGFIPSLTLQVANLIYILFFLSEDDLRNGTLVRWGGLARFSTSYLQPCCLFLKPSSLTGLLAALMLHIAYNVLFPRKLRIKLLSRMLSIQAPWSTSHLPFSAGRLVVWFLNGTNLIDISANTLILFNVEAFLTAVVLTPVEVKSVRLAIQRNDAGPKLDSSSQEEVIDYEITVEYSGAEEDVIELKVDREPYEGVIDCAKCIVTEEGCPLDQLLLRPDDDPIVNFS
ncbi:hypothetical protein CONPUDRAFT_73781 [Coniophora puteana RWD-64-598 SS2]|uniref:Uncharacterized protein n=1 Tax=Coniophora puteana (strain RWD-64-598) TaxID=741705 RepID=A0A5M3MPU3_CONPW|nr:uncharacterized protein CONPUDRAFT_73781 [Coniophora puteana RWD-64-598 SS2]EIW80724.1 hypothetical protein CONPUDRAFT_73781 [Coniophora puteana RWD-64-598 SS2]